MTLGFLLVLGSIFCLVFGPFFRSTAEDDARLAANRSLVARYGLTDLALFTEARYTRHPSQSDLHTAFQDHPGAFEHFPSGSLLNPRTLPIHHHAPLAGKTSSPD